MKLDIMPAIDSVMGQISWNDGGNVCEFIMVHRGTRHGELVHQIKQLYNDHMGQGGVAGFIKHITALAKEMKTQLTIRHNFE